MRPRCCHSIKNQNSAREDVNIFLHLANRPLLPDLHGKVEMRDSNRTFYLGTSPALSWELIQILRWSWPGKTRRSSSPTPRWGEVGILGLSDPGYPELAGGVPVTVSLTAGRCRHVTLSLYRQTHPSNKQILIYTIYPSHSFLSLKYIESCPVLRELTDLAIN